ncbi:DUF4129 domain-containing protein [Prauserella muralis]|uniref:Protein-glutamine gamma-glutamyltransferase-like C-terminal domain-containing protein n=1 Tax=Prauserella muralis TaxID=588067 RepID=A0A2V4BAT8_9PSEU|nr:DUF4129 domain-containing protein [Prauserella muralis]PXY32484.1 hypothetical protein BAY60_09520 [Prauserella muralis]TWE23814.1 uncharacterized protein DUF4129 [Prauserella muralis]
MIAGADVPVELGRDEARRLARAELADPDYAQARPSPVQQAIDWLGDRLADLFGALAGATPGGVAGLVVFLLLLVVLVLVIRLRVGKPARRGRVRGEPVFTGAPRTASGHRQAAEHAAERGELAEAVRERFRAVVRELEERGVLDERAGRTAGEAATEAGRLVPQFAGELHSAATLFDEVHYGGRAATVAAYARLSDLDTRLAGARPVAP